MSMEVNARFCVIGAIFKGHRAKGTVLVNWACDCVDLHLTACCMCCMFRCIQLLHAQSFGRLKPKHSCSYLLYLNQRGKVLLSFRNTCL